MARNNTALVIYLQYDTVQYTAACRPYSSSDYASAILAAAGLTPGAVTIQYCTYAYRTWGPGAPAVDEKWLARIFKHQFDVSEPFGVLLS